MDGYGTRPDRPAFAGCCGTARSQSRVTVTRIRSAAALVVSPSKQYIPGVEAGHCGPVRLGVLKGALLIDAQDRCRFRYQQGVDENLLAEVERFENTLPPVP